MTFQPKNAADFGSDYIKLKLRSQFISKTPVTGVYSFHKRAETKRQTPGKVGPSECMWFSYALMSYPSQGFHWGPNADIINKTIWDCWKKNIKTSCSYSTKVHTASHFLSKHSFQLCKWDHYCIWLSVVSISLSSHSLPFSLFLLSVKASSHGFLEFLSKWEYWLHGMILIRPKWTSAKNNFHHYKLIIIMCLTCENSEWSKLPIVCDEI